MVRGLASNRVGGASVVAVAFVAAASAGTAVGAHSSQQSQNEEIPVPINVPYDRLVNAAAEPQNWFSYNGSYASTRFSPLDQINRDNVATQRPRLGLPDRSIARRDDAGGG